MLNYDTSFIESQFPVSKLSKESYKERKAGSSQTLTSLGKWWGRKPLILVRAIILGVLLPATDNPKKDREVFLKILMMDEEGLFLRKNKSIPIKVLFENATESEKRDIFQMENDRYIPKYRSGVKANLKSELQNRVYNRMTYDQKLVYCMRPEELDNTTESSWRYINDYLDTSANNLPELVEQLGIRKFGRTPKIGDCFAGGGSIPFEAGRIGANVYASDLNPLAGLLTWSSLNILNKSDDEIKKLKSFLDRVYDAVNEKVNSWGIERNEEEWRAKTYLYCNEAVCPDCNIKVPLIPNLVISESSSVVAQLELNMESANYNINIINGASTEEIKFAKDKGTVKENSLHCPNCGNSTPITVLRKDRKESNGSIKHGLRRWGKNEYLSRPDDVFNERLYAIKYIEKFPHKTWDEVYKKHERTTDSTSGKVHYVKPTELDINRERMVEKFLGQNFDTWVEKGYIPAVPIEEGYNTGQLIRERGWSYWHQLFNPRQLLLLGLLSEKVYEFATNKEELVLGILVINKCADWNSKLSIWNTARDAVQATYTNQALNTLFNYATRALSSTYSTWVSNIKNYEFNSSNIVNLVDARQNEEINDIWITDPPYADAVNYHELSEFFLAWDKGLKSAFPEWYLDSKRALAVRGSGESFNTSMVEIYSNLAKNMPDNGMQVVMFTHQNVSVWADLTSILWSAGLRVTAAWNIATETESGGLKDGNYVKGTVLLVLRKHRSDDTAYLDELYPEVEVEVKRQIDSMRELDDKEDPNFTDADYLLAAYAASLKVLTSYNNIEDIDVNYEISRTKSAEEVSPIEQIINEAIKIAYDYLTPTGFDSFTWKTLIPEERFYIKGLDFEKENIYQLGAYQEIARGFGVKDYKPLLASTKANQTRLKTSKEFAMRGISDTDKFGSSVFRNVLAALYQSIKSEDTSKGRNWLKNEVPNYWNQRSTIIELLNFISTLGHHEHMTHWEGEAKYARLLIELVKNDGV